MQTKTKNTPNTKNLLILMRHGERADHAGLIPKFHPYDAELTELGKSQAAQMGRKIELFLQENYPKKALNLKLISSPFARTVQTCKQVLNVLANNNDNKNNKNKNLNLNIEDKINIDYYFSECRKTKDFKDPDFISFIILLNKLELLESDLEATQIEFRNKPDGIVEKTFENKDECFERVKIGLEKMHESEFKDFNFCSYKNENEKNENEEIEKLNEGKVNVFIIVSHGEPVMQLNRALGYPGKLDSDLVLYCDAYCYEIEHSLNPGYRTKYLEKLSLFEQANENI